VGLIVAIELCMRHETIFYSANTINLHKEVYFMLLRRKIFTLEDYYCNAVRMIGSIEVFFKLLIYEDLMHWYYLADTTFLDEIEGISNDTFERRKPGETLKLIARIA
jgi:hypothetical protein